MLGDIIIVLNNDLEVVWAWNSFDHLDVTRMATLNETCAPVGGGCPPFHNSQIANDWLHGNSVQQTPDGDLLYSARHQDWLIKIDYRFGEGSGNVIWRLGKDGDFQAISDDPYPWFSHQHDAGFTPDGSLLTVFDNGNMRFSTDESTHSRGQVVDDRRSQPDRNPSVERRFRYIFVCPGFRVPSPGRRVPFQPRMGTRLRVGPVSRT